MEIRDLAQLRLNPFENRVTFEQTSKEIPAWVSCLNPFENRVTFELYFGGGLASPHKSKSLREQGYVWTTMKPTTASLLSKSLREQGYV